MGVAMIASNLFLWPSPQNAFLEKGFKSGSWITSGRKDVAALAVPVDVPAPILQFEPLIRVERSFDARQMAEEQPTWLAHFPLETIMKISVEASGPQGVLGMFRSEA
jgi:hypothetical protein